MSCEQGACGSDVRVRPILFGRALSVWCGRPHPRVSRSPAESRGFSCGRAALSAPRKSQFSTQRHGFSRAAPPVLLPHRPSCYCPPERIEHRACTMLKSRRTPCPSAPSNGLKRNSLEHIGAAVRIPGYAAGYAEWTGSFDSGRRFASESVSVAQNDSPLSYGTAESRAPVPIANNAGINGRSSAM